MNSIDEFEQLQNDIKELNVRISKSEARQEFILESLRTLGFNSIEDATKALKKLKLENSRTAEQIQDMKNKWTKKWTRKINLTKSDFRSWISKSD